MFALMRNESGGSQSVKERTCNWYDIDLATTRLLLYSVTEVGPVYNLLSLDRDVRELELFTCQEHWCDVFRGRGKEDQYRHRWHTRSLCGQISFWSSLFSPYCSFTSFVAGKSANSVREEFGIFTEQETMSKRVSYLRSTRNEEAGLMCAAWAPRPRSERDGPSSFVLFGRGQGKEQTEVLNGLAVSEYDFQADTLSDTVCRLFLHLCCELCTLWRAFPATNDVGGGLILCCGRRYKVTMPLQLVEILPELVQHIIWFLSVSKKFLHASTLL